MEQPSIIDLYPQFEICISADNHAQMKQNIMAAQQGGAHRIELCSDTQNQGLTPSVVAIDAAKSVSSDLILLTMIRPRAGDFVYREDEHQQMQTSIWEAKKAGAGGVVFGALTPSGALHRFQVENLIAIAQDLAKSPYTIAQCGR